MTTVESKIVAIRRSDEQVYTVLSSFQNFTSAVEAAKLKDWEADDDTCKFRVDGIGLISLKIIEREPFKSLKITGDEGVPFEFFIWLQFKQVAPYDTRMKITLKAELNMMMKMVIGSKLQEGIDTVAETIAKALNV